VANYRRLEEYRERLAAASGSETVADLEAELADLGRRLGSAADPVAREALEQSSAMCAARLEHARALEPGFERVKAQQEVILQTLASAQASMARARMAPTPVSLPDMQRLQESVLGVNNQTRAVEEAVQEVMALRAG